VSVLLYKFTGKEREKDSSSRESDRDRYSGRYEDGQKAYRTNVPRDAKGSHACYSSAASLFIDPAI